MSSSQFEQIKANYPLEKTNDDITLSYDQAVNLKRMIRSDRWMKGYPELGENDRVNFDAVVAFLIELRDTFLWDDYEKRMMECLPKTSVMLPSACPAAHSLWHSLSRGRLMEGQGQRPSFRARARPRIQMQGSRQAPVSRIKFGKSGLCLSPSSCLSCLSVLENFTSGVHLPCSGARKEGYQPLGRC